MKMKRVLLPESNDYLRFRLDEILVSSVQSVSITSEGQCCVTANAFQRTILCDTRYRGGKNAPPNHYGPLVVELPAYLVRKGVPTYKGPVK